MKKHKKAMALLGKESGNTNLKIWQEKHGISNKGASEMLGLTERQIIKIRTGEIKQNKRITLMIKLWGRMLRQIEKNEKAEQKLYRMDRFQKRIESPDYSEFDKILKMTDNKEHDQR